MTGSEQGPTRASVARRILEHEAARDPAAGLTTAALERVCARVVENLCNSLGEDGSNALLARALIRAQKKHPALLDVRLAGRRDGHLDGVTAAGKAHGIAALTAGVEGILEELSQVLGRLIGEDMATRLMQDTDELFGANDRGAS